MFLDILFYTGIGLFAIAIVMTIVTFILEDTETLEDRVEREVKAAERRFKAEVEKAELREAFDKFDEHSKQAMASIDRCIKHLEEINKGLGNKKSQ
jgi:hypothetical protein